MQQLRDRDDSVPFLSRFIATGFFSGYIPWASGTFGTLVGALFFFIPQFSNPIALSIAIVVCLVIGAVTSNHVAQVEGHRLTKSAQLAKEAFQSCEHKTPDPSIVVIDEILGIWIAMFAIPVTPIAVVIAFFAFRAFDIVKPFPARQCERFGGGWGIMLDDVVAGIYANVATRVVVAGLFSLFPSLFQSW